MNDASYIIVSNNNDQKNDETIFRRIENVCYFWRAHFSFSLQSSVFLSHYIEVTHTNTNTNTLLVLFKKKKNNLNSNGLTKSRNVDASRYDQNS